jgi:glycosyltransferase involved in cell wall biosynthesis
MKIAINASTLSGTGVVQVATSFIEECKNIPGHSYYIFMSTHVASQIDSNQFPANFKFYVIQPHPRFLFSGYASRKKLRQLEHQLNPDCVFSVFGPSYWSPKSTHLMGYAYANYVYPDSPFFSLLSPAELVKNLIYKILHRFLLKRNGAYYVCETNDISKRAERFLSVPGKRIFTVSNTYSHYFDHFKPSSVKILPEPFEGEFRLLSLCSFAKHKNLEILNEVIPLLNADGTTTKFKFVLTIDEQLFKTKFSDEARESIINVGRVDVFQCPQLYHECDALFLPTLLECLSANYPESMKMERPIITSNLSFATEICKSAALYFDPLNPVDIAQKIIQVAHDENLRAQLVKEGNGKLQFFSTSSERAKEYLSICKQITHTNE